jgi:hypothetical protein
MEKNLKAIKVGVDSTSVAVLQLNKERMSRLQKQQKNFFGRQCCSG